MVHHIKPLEDYPELALVPENLISLCNTCHEREHKRWQKKKEKEGKPNRKRKARVIVSQPNPEISPPAN